MTSVLQVRRRPVTPRDLNFLRERFAERRDDLLVLPRDSRDVIVDMQFRAARRQLEVDHPGATRDMVYVDDLPVGVVVLDMHPDHVEIVELAVRLAARGRGIGSQVLQTVCREAAEREIGLRTRVWSSSPRTRAFYERHGFGLVAAAAGYDELYRPAA